MQDDKSDPLRGVAGYFSERLARYGETPRGVDWNGAESQTLRFEQLGRIIAEAGGFSLNDLGCSYGALFDFLLPVVVIFEVIPSQQSAIIRYYIGV